MIQLKSFEDAFYLQSLIDVIAMLSNTYSPDRICMTDITELFIGFINIRLLQPKRPDIVNIELLNSEWEICRLVPHMVKHIDEIDGKVLYSIV